MADIIFYADCLDGKVAAYIYSRKHHIISSCTFIPFRNIPKINRYNLKDTDNIIILGANKEVIYPRDIVQISYKVFYQNKKPEQTTSLLVFSESKPKNIPKYLEYIKIKELKLGKFKESEIFCTQLENLLRKYNTPNNPILQGLYDHPETELDSLFNYIMLIGEANYNQYLETIHKNAERAHITKMDDGTSIGILNTRIYIADIADYLIKKRGCSAVIIWYLDKKDSMVFQLRSVGEIDVSEIARLYTGDGYRNAAGFTVPFRVGSLILENMLADPGNSHEVQLNKINQTELKSVLSILGVPSND